MRYNRQIRQHGINSKCETASFLGSALPQYEVFPSGSLAACLVQLAKILSPNLISVTARLALHSCITVHMYSLWRQFKGKGKYCLQF